MTLLKMDPAERAVLDQVIAWRRMRMSWQAVGRSLGVTGEAARAKYEGAVAYALVPPPAPRLLVSAPAHSPVVEVPAHPVRAVIPAVQAVQAAPPRAVSVKMKRVPKARSKPRTARSVAAPVDLTAELEGAAFDAACRVLGLTAEASAPKQRGWYRARVLAAAGYALWKWRPKKSVAQAFGLHGSMVAPSGMARRALTEAMVVAVRKALWDSGFRP